MTVCAVCGERLEISSFLGPEYGYLHSGDEPADGHIPVEETSE